MNRDLSFPELTLAAKRLDLDVYDLAESMITRMDNGEPYWSALHGVVAEAAQRRGIYYGETKARIDSGDVFAVRPAPATIGRAMAMITDGRADVFDALAMAGVSGRGDGAVEAAFEERKAAKLDAVAMNEQDNF